MEPGTYRVTSFQPIQLYHDYASPALLFSQRGACLSCSPYTPPNIASDSLFPLISAMHAQNQPQGVTEGTLLEQAQQASPNFSLAQLRQALQTGLQAGIFSRVQPIVINYLAPMPAVRYVLNANLDRPKANQKYTRYLLHLVGGLQGIGFHQWFKPFANTTNHEFRLDYNIW